MLAAADIAIKSPGDGLAPYYLDQVLGQVLVRDLRADQPLSLEALQTVDGVAAAGTAPRATV
jgi:N-acetylneuraminate synthase/sialic acid synthase